MSCWDRTESKQGVCDYKQKNPATWYYFNIVFSVGTMFAGEKFPQACSLETQADTPLE